MSRIYTILFALAGLAALAAALNWSVLRSVFAGDPNDFVEEMVLEEPIMIEGREAGLDYHLVTLFFGTNRGVLEGEFDRPAERFSNEDSGILTYGTAEVSIPFDHEVGVIEAPFWATEFLFGENPAKHVLLLSMDNADEDVVLAQLRAELEETTNKVLVYIHGYNTGVETAALRAGQMTHDLQWRGPSFFFSWPSQGGFEDYGNDQEKARGSRRELRKMFEDIAETETEEIVIIAHSMGNDLLTQTLELMHVSNSEALDKIKTVILAAPDINADNFISDIVPVFAAMKANDENFSVTMYASENDSALQVSQVVNGVRRIGRVPRPSNEERAMLDPVLVVDASKAVSDFFEHTYINASETVIEDVFCILTLSPDPSKRKETLENLPNGNGVFGFAIKLDNPGKKHEFKCE